MRIMVALVAIMVLTAVLVKVCSSNWMARHVGGTITVNLPPNMKLVGAAWKETSLWYLYRPMVAGETPSKATYQEDSNFGLLQGKVVFEESSK